VDDFHVVRLRDGRDLAWVEYGVAAAPPVFAFHGSPGTCLTFAGLHDVAADKQVRLLAVDRPGYGRSSFDPRRTYQSWIADVRELADHLGVDRFGVVGHSSGGPNAAACARFLGDRVTGCALVSSPAPPEAAISKDEMLRSNRIAQALSRFAPRLAGAAFQAGLRQAARRPQKMFDWMAGTVPAPDAAVLASPEVRTSLRSEITTRLAPTAGRAAMQDLALERARWGFNLHDITTSVHVWHGDVDRNVPMANGVFLAHAIPAASLHRVSGEAHWLLYPHFREILDGVT
jgi:pimeloyl-ACP methyl ester carboxylesterase